jgi:glycosyltransferase involved in cell wall biosynthesis
MCRSSRVRIRRIVSRFGRCIGRFDGSGQEAVPAFVAALGELIADTDLRQRLGRAGREWVAVQHSRERFLAAFRALAAELGVAWLER